jgi:hypothetical protein
MLAAQGAPGPAEPRHRTEAPDSAAHDTVSRFGLPREPGRAEPLSELSGLAWDADEGLLYAVSDRGVLHHFRLNLSNDTILGVEPLRSRRLDGLDAEGLAVRNAANGIAGDTELLVVTEGVPRVLRVRPDGAVTGELRLPAALSDAGRFQARNRMIEAIAWHPEHGLLAAREATDENGEHRVHAADREWRFAAGAGRDSRVKALEALPDGRLALLERSRPVRGKGLLTRVRLLDPARCGGEKRCPAETLALFSSTDQSANYEGMTLVGNRQLLLVSDLASKKGAAAGFLLLGLPP